MLFTPYEKQIVSLTTKANKSDGVNFNERLQYNTIDDHTPIECCNHSLLL